MRPRRRPANTRRDERGVAVPLVAIALAVLVIATSFTVDLGRWMNRSRDLQLVADIAALDAARLLDGRSAAEQQATIDEAATASARRNGFTAGAGRRLTARLGHADGNTFTPVAPSEVPDAIEVRASDEVPLLLQQGAKSTSRSAIATSRATAGIEVGSGLLGDRGSCSGAPSTDTAGLATVLGLLLGAPLSLDAVSYQGLACTRLALGDLAVAAGVGSPDELLGVQMTVAELLAVAATAARTTDGQVHASVAASALDALASLAVSAGLGDVALGELITLNGGGLDDHADVTVGVGHLVSGALYAARDGQVLAVPSLGVAVPGLLKLTVSLGIVEPPQVVIGPVGSTVHTAQVRLRVDATVADIPLVGTVQLPLVVEAASATATLRAVHCTSEVPTAVDLHVETTGARVMIGKLSDAALTGDATTAPEAAPIVSLLGLPLITAATTVSVAGIDEDVRVDAADIGTRIRVHGEMSAASSGSLALAGLPIDVLVLGVLVPALDAVLATVVTPLLDLLGAQLAYADVRVFDPTCPQPRLTA